MAEDNKKALFWTSYSDLMTSLFFAILVLFVVVVVAMSRTINGVVATNDQLTQILHLQDQFNTLTTSSSLQYDEQKRMFYAKDFVGIEIFEPNKDIIKKEYLPIVERVGVDIKMLIDSLKVKNKSFCYQLVIEGTAAIPYKALIEKSFDPDNTEMYKLSYRRALALYNKWKHLNFRDGNTEVIIAGSGFNGINRDMINEDNNKRFIIQIIPKIEKPKESPVK